MGARSSGSAASRSAASPNRRPRRAALETPAAPPIHESNERSGTASAPVRHLLPAIRARCDRPSALSRGRSLQSLRTGATRTMVRRTDLDPRPTTGGRNCSTPSATSARAAAVFSPSTEAAETAESCESRSNCRPCPMTRFTWRSMVTGWSGPARGEPGGRSADKDYYFSERAYGRLSRSFQLPADAVPSVTALRTGRHPEWREPR